MKLTAALRLMICLPLLIALPHLVAKENINPISQPPVDSLLGKFVWADLYSTDLEASINFYQKTFAWQVKKSTDSHGVYHLFSQNGQPIAGLIERFVERNKTDKALWIGSVVTNNLVAKTNQAQQLGGKILLAAHDFPIAGQRAVIADKHGGIVALLDSSNSQSNFRKNIGNIWTWAQLFSVEPEQAASFYQHVLTYSVESEAITENIVTYVLKHKEHRRAGIVPLPASLPQRDHWVNFIEVAAVADTLALAIENGAKVIYAPNAYNHVAIIADPNGALLGLIEQGSADGDSSTDAKD